MNKWKRACACLLAAVVLCTAGARALFAPDLMHDHDRKQEQPGSLEGGATRDDCAGYLTSFVAYQLGWDAKDLVRYLCDTHGEPLSDANENATALCALGIAKGRGDGTFGGALPLTRQEAATFLARAYAVYAGELPAGSGDTFADADQIAPWARGSVNALAEMGVFLGYGDGRFAPTDPFTKAQCVATLERLYKNAPVSRKNGNVTPPVAYDAYMAYVEQQDEDCHRLNYGTSKESRVDGPVASFVRQTVAAGTMNQYTRCQFVYRDGGVRTVYDLGVCDSGCGVLSAGVLLSEEGFSADGGTFTCVMTLTREANYNHTHPAGRYQITVDVRSLEATSRPLAE